MWKVFVFVIFDVTLLSASCQNRCQCPPEAPKCAAGVSLVLDSCGCCKVCTRQLNEDCSQTESCDQIKGLECNFGGEYGTIKGICRARSDGRTCEYNKKIYQNGETFKPNCKHQCTCLDGAVGCVPLCPRELTLPKVSCARPRLIRVPGHCCEQLVCPDETERSGVKKFRKKHRLSEEHFNSEKKVAAAWTETLPAFRAHAVASTMRVDCRPQTTAWSYCSRSCGAGVSTRRTNSSETQCEMVTETRICEVRPCGQIPDQRFKNGKKCKQMETTSRPIKMSFEGCRSVKRFQFRYCGSCSDGRCCRPHRTQTVPVLFRCKNGETYSWMVMMVQSCKCDFNCTDPDHKTSQLLNHIHKLRH